MNEIAGTDAVVPLPGRQAQRLLVYGCDQEQRYRWIANPAEGFSEAGLIGRRDDEILPPDIVADLVALKQRALDTGQSQSDEITLLLSGRPRTYAVIAEPSRDAKGRVTGLTVAAFDRTDRHETERALRESEARLALATTAADIGIWDWDLATDRIVYSERARAICGLRPHQDLTSADIRRVTHPDDLPFTSAQLRRALDPAVRDRSSYEYRVVRPDGAIRWVVAYGEPVFADVDGQKRAIRYAGTIQGTVKLSGRERNEGGLAKIIPVA